MLSPDPFTQVAQAITAALSAHAGFSALVRAGNLIDPTAANFEDFKADVSPGDLPEALLRPAGFELMPFGPSSKTATLRQSFDLVVTTDALNTTSLHAVKYQALCAMASAGDTLGLAFVRRWRITSGKEHDSPARGTRRWVAVVAIDVEMTLARQDLLS